MTPTSPCRWFESVPSRRLVIVRSLSFGYATCWLVVRGRYVADVAGLPSRRWEPIGVTSSLASPPSGAVVVTIWFVSLLACGAATANRLVRLSAPLGAAGMLFLATFTSSFGQVFHTEHLLVLHLSILAVSSVVEPIDGETTSAWPLNLMMSVVVVVYVVAGIAKLRYSGLSWVTGDVLRNWIAIDNLRKLLFDDLYSPVGGRLSAVDWVWAPIAIGTIVVELGAPVALIPGRVRYGWLLAAWSFHVGVLALMAISFPYQLLGVAYAAFLPMEHIVDGIGARVPVLREIGDRTA